MTGKLCDLAASLPVIVGTLLDQEQYLRRGRFREETLTDIIVASLAAFAGPELIIEYPNEATTGGDLDLEFWNVESGQQLLIRIQAKRLNSNYENNRNVDIEHRSYHHLLHKVPTTKEYQFKTLVENCEGYLPLYIFYNHQSVVSEKQYDDDNPEVRGINLAFAFDIANEMQAKVDAIPRRLHHKRLSHLRPYFFGLEKILCPDDLKHGEIPTPESVSKSLEEIWKKGDDIYGYKGKVSSVLRCLFEPQNLYPKAIERRHPQIGPSIRFNADVTRCTITFISETKKDDTCPITDTFR